jgi:hypothetical protein
MSTLNLPLPQQTLVPLLPLQLRRALQPAVGHDDDNMAPNRPSSRPSTTRWDL